MRRERTAAQHHDQGSRGRHQRRRAARGEGLPQVVHAGRTAHHVERAFLPSATPRRTSVAQSGAQGVDHDGLDGVEPVLGLVEHDRGRAGEDRVGDLSTV